MGFQANVEGSQKIVDLLRPQLQKANPELLAKVDANFKKVDTILAKYRTKDGFENYDKLTDADRNALKGPIYCAGGRSGATSRCAGAGLSVMQYEDENGVNEPSRRRLLKGIGALALAGSCPVAHAQKTQSAPGTLSPDARNEKQPFMVSIRQGS